MLYFLFNVTMLKLNSFTFIDFIVISNRIIIKLYFNSSLSVISFVCHHLTLLYLNNVSQICGAIFSLKLSS